MATAVLENNNKFAYLGLKRRPTYDELIGLINENASLFGPTPDRRASAFKASPEGSFFDGLNYTDKLKEEQERILNKQMRDILFRQNVGNQTIAIAQLQQNNQGGSTPSSQSNQLPQQTSLGEGLLQEQLQQRAQQALQRAQQTGDAHRGILGGGLDTIASRIFNLTPLGSRAPTPIAQPMPQSFNISSEDEPELMTDAEMQTARGEPPPEDAERKITYSTNIKNMSASELRFQLFLRGVYLEDQLPNRIKGKGGGKTQKEFYQDTANKMIRSGRWQTRIEEQLLRSRILDYNRITARSSR